MTLSLGMFASAVFLLAPAPGVRAAGAPVLLAPSPAARFDSPMPAISGSAPGASEVLVFIDGALNGTARVSGGRFSYAPFLPLGSGGHAIQLRSRDAESGELSDPSLVTLVTIIPNPAPTLLVPRAHEELGWDRVWAGGVARNDSLIRVLVDGAERARVKVKNHRSGTGSFGVELEGLGLGEHAITAVARDSRGKESFVASPVVVTIFPATPAPILFRPVVNADSGIDRPFVTGIAKNGLIVSIVVDGTVAQRIPLGTDASGVINFAWQPPAPLRLGRHTIEAFASDRGKLSNNSTPVFWQVGEAASGVSVSGQAPGERGEARAEAAGEGQKEEPTPPISVSSPEPPKPLSVKDDLAAPGAPVAPVVPDVLPEAGETDRAGRVVADDEGVLGETRAPDEVAVAPLDGGAGEGGEVVEIAPGAVVRRTDQAPREFTLNTSLIIGIVILVFLLLSILVWYIQEKRAQLGERVVNIFREEDEGSSTGQAPGTSRLPAEEPAGAERPSGGAPGGGEQKKKEDVPPPPSEPPRYEPPFRFDDPDDVPPPPPPMF